MLLPMIRYPEEARLIEVPEMKIPAPPADSIVPSMLNADGLAVNAFPATVKTAEVAIIALWLPISAMLLGPWLTRLDASEMAVLAESPLWPFSGLIMSCPDGASDKIVCAGVTGSPPTERVVPPIVTAEGSEIVIAWPAALTTVESKAADCTGTMLDPIMRPDGPIESNVPAIFTAGPPAEIVVLPTEIGDEGFAVIVDPPAVKINLAEWDAGSSIALIAPLFSELSADLGVPNAL